ncbi:exopolysaccharide biosynthesis protein [Nitratireductor aquimarinus]|nr:exopolysaccharide biosynthesis protein [Nitratireductor aquimarinus]MBN7763575.1 exopolysaccharide biosynthesis protein [Nitratireductor aquibiodomus]MBN7774698.1 exopolysaccharide biosynthesis protein [Nitratireductor pacificus]MBY6023674.1 exopolysaccharide biosynthesis protein [Nitratireductor sp. DP7N14-4]MCV0377641.1 exopolysaccharide biosynthesis protein [Nitratireductor sp.]
MKAEGTDLDTVLGAPPAELPPRRLSRIFRDLAKRAEDKVSIGEIRQALGDRSFATLFVFFACLNLLPFPPGSTVILGPPLVLIAIQMVMGNRTVWLPNFLLNKSIGADKFRHMSERFIPRLILVERLIKPRYWPFARDHADRVIGLIALVLSIAVTLPIPLGNWFPAFSCVLVGLALSERDGILLSIAITCGVLSLLVIAGVVVGASMMAGAVMH